ncbi:MAG: ATP-dependent sacrificial sulfur transferase LarE [Ruminococcus sp.]|nr:ATP-dependent sacrificial sulfur transferase LarE [Ruminococcus sp.]
MDTIADKKKKLAERLRALGSAAVAFSAGVDSTFLALFARDILGGRLLAVTVKGPFIPGRELDAAVNFCKENNIRHVIAEADVFSVKEFRENAPDRCYHCKKLIFTEIKRIAAEYGISNILDGSNLDDVSDYRPGMKALDELGIISPLRDAGLTKDNIRELSRELGLPTADKPSFACLATRIPCGDGITLQKLQMAEQAEQKLFDLGFTQFRVRIHGDTARIEIMPEEFTKIISPETSAEINSRFKELGFGFVTLDLGGYRMGSTNKNIPRG